MDDAEDQVESWKPNRASGMNQDKVAEYFDRLRRPKANDPLSKFSVGDLEQMLETAMGPGNGFARGHRVDELRNELEKRKE